MSDSVSIDASKARKSFFKILNEVGSGKKSFLIKKSGVPIARVVSVKDDFDVMDLAGAWKDINAGALLSYIAEGRKDNPELKRQLPKLK